MNFQPTRRQWLGWTAAALAGMPGFALAQSWPTKAVNLIVPFPLAAAPTLLPVHWAPSSRASPANRW